MNIYHLEAINNWPGVTSWKKQTQWSGQDITGLKTPQPLVVKTICLCWCEDTVTKVREQTHVGHQGPKLSSHQMRWSNSYILFLKSYSEMISVCFNLCVSDYENCCCMLKLSGRLFCQKQEEASNAPLIPLFNMSLQQLHCQLNPFQINMSGDLPSRMATGGQ